MSKNVTQLSLQDLAEIARTASIRADREAKAAGLDIEEYEDAGTLDEGATSRK